MAIRYVEVPFHQQDGISSCGAAAAQMILASIGLGILDQADLDRVIPSNAVDGLSPGELRSTLNKTKQTYPLTFVACYDRNAAIGAQRIAEAIVRRGVGVPAVIWANHWVVVTGVSLAGVAPTSGRFDIRGFFVNDPLPDTPTSAQPRPQCQLASAHHHATDDCCGFGMEFGSANSYVTIQGWLRHEWSAFYTDPTGIEPSGYVTLVGEQTPPADLVRSSTGTLVVSTVPVGDPPVKIDALTAQQKAEQGIADHGLTCDGPLAKRLAGVRAFSASASFNSFAGNHYRVTLVGPARNLVGYAFVDMVTGEFFGVQAPPSEDAPPPAAEAFVFAVLQSRATELVDVISQDAIERRAFTVHDTLVWEPCVQSMTPYAPFFAVNVGAAILYVGRDGLVHRSLEPHPPRRSNGTSHVLI